MAMEENLGDLVSRDSFFGEIPVVKSFEEFLAEDLVLFTTHK